MSAMVFDSQGEDSRSVPFLIIICPKCGRYIKINDHCECEALFFSAQSKRKSPDRFIEL
jgi:hypothetical protein